jgi:hypothetical protein
MHFTVYMEYLKSQRSYSNGKILLTEKKTDCVLYGRKKEFVSYLKSYVEFESSELYQSSYIARGKTRVQHCHYIEIESLFSKLTLQVCFFAIILQ